MWSAKPEDLCFPLIGGWGCLVLRDLDGGVLGKDCHTCPQGRQGGACLIFAALSPPPPAHIHAGTLERKHARTHTYIPVCTCRRAHTCLSPAFLPSQSSKALGAAVSGACLPIPPPWGWCRWSQGSLDLPLLLSWGRRGEGGKATGWIWSPEGCNRGFQVGGRGVPVQGQPRQGAVTLSWAGGDGEVMLGRWTSGVWANILAVRVRPPAPCVAVPEAGGAHLARHSQYPGVVCLPDPPRGPPSTHNVGPLSSFSGSQTEPLGRGSLPSQVRALLSMRMG